ncbi:unnamed protein product [Thlaspi arvense]|uniref:NADH dehydrogenase subunit 4 n=1 Tax=Thlaspi arvense TaxID=13288 RepID=A0AAU9T4K2_THLAR|nr:unnamed protein product [Thlaspi arvense]
MLKLPLLCIHQVKKFILLVILMLTPFLTVF